MGFFQKAKKAIYVLNKGNIVKRKSDFMVMIVIPLKGAFIE